MYATPVVDSQAMRMSAQMEVTRNQPRLAWCLHRWMMELVTRMKCNDTGFFPGQCTVRVFHKAPLLVEKMCR